MPVRGCNPSRYRHATSCDRGCNPVRGCNPSRDCDTTRRCDRGCGRDLKSSRRRILIRGCVMLYGLVREM